MKIFITLKNSEISVNVITKLREINEKKMEENVHELKILNYNKE